MRQRKTIRSGGLKVIHRHCAGDRRFLRVSELVFVKGVPKAILEWIDLGSTATPVYLCDLDPKLLRGLASDPRTYYYGGETVDPRYELIGPTPPMEH